MVRPGAPARLHEGDCGRLARGPGRRGLGAVSINVRITAVRKLAVEAADNGLLAPELPNGITRVRGVAAKGVRLGNWLTAKQAQALLNAPDTTTNKGLRDRAILAVLLPCGIPPELAFNCAGIPTRYGRCRVLRADFDALIWPQVRQLKAAPLREDTHPS